MSVSVNGPSLSSSSIPIGAIVMWVTNSIPAGWLACQGQTIQKSAYPELVKILSGNDSATSANLPDMRGVSPAGTGYCSARGSSGNIKASPGLNVKDTMGSNTVSFSFTPSHISNSQTISVPLPAHAHTYTTVTGVNYTSDYDRTFINRGLDSISIGNATTTVSGTNDNTIRVDFPGHSAISKSISIVHPVYGVTFIIKAKSE